MAKNPQLLIADNRYNQLPTPENNSKKKALQYEELIIKYIGKY